MSTSETRSIDDLRIDREPERDDSRPGGKLLGLFAVLVLLSLAGWWWLVRGGAAEVTVAPVLELSSAAGPASVLDASGYVTARRRATVSSKITAQVEEVLVEEGMAVEEGQVLARLDDSIAERQVALAQAQLEASRRSIAETEARLEEARLTRARADKLSQTGVGSAADLDAAVAEEASLEARLDVARENVVVAVRQLALRRQQLADTVIRAPFTGVAISKDAQPGEMVSPVSAGGGFTRTGICTLVDMGSLEIEVDVNEAYINRVHDDQRVFAVLDAYPDWRIPGAVITTVPSADRQKATVKVRIGFDDEILGDPRLLPDMGVKVSFVEAQAAEDGGSPAPRRTIPRAAVDADGNVFVVTDGGRRVERRSVSLGPADGDSIQVLTGLAAGERVVVDGPDGLEDGDRIEIEEP